MRGGWEGPIRQFAAAQQRRRHVHRRDGSRPDSWTSRTARIRRPGPTSTTTATWISSSATNAPHSRLYRNRGDGTFEDVTRKAGVEVRTFVKGAAWGDYDRDGYPDLYLSNFGEANILFHNNGDGTFTDVTTTARRRRPANELPDVVLRLRQRRMARPVRGRLRPVGRRDAEDLHRRAAIRGDVAALSQREGSAIRGRYRANGARPGDPDDGQPTMATSTTTAGSTSTSAPVRRPSQRSRPTCCSGTTTASDLWT